MIFRIEIVYFSISIVLVCFGAIRCSNKNCSCPEYISNNLGHYETLARNLLFLNDLDSIDILTQGVYLHRPGSTIYEMNPKASISTSHINALVKELIDANIQMFTFSGNNVCLRYYYKYYSNFLIDKSISKYLIYENDPIDFNNDEHDVALKILCNEKITKKLRHYIEVNRN